jgi:hypothetical protein
VSLETPNLADPMDGQEWNGYRRGDTFTHPRVGLVTFYRYDSLRDWVEAFTRDGYKAFISDYERIGEDREFRGPTEDSQSDEPRQGDNWLARFRCWLSVH